MRIAIRADAGITQGTGHVMRCLTLAKSLLAHGHSVKFIGNVEGVPWLQKLLKLSQIEVMPTQKNFLNIAEIVSFKFDLVVIDSYEFEIEDVNKLATKLPVFAIIDCPNDELLIQGYLDQNLGAETRHNTYSNNVELKLLGSNYALVREEFLNIRLSGPSKIKNITNSNMVCFFGGSDPTGASIQMAKILSLGPRPNLTFIAPKKMHVELGNILGDRPLNLLSHTNELPTLIKSADTAISAAGTSAWDLATVGIPSTYAAIAANQFDSFNAITSNRVGIGLDFNTENETSYERIVETIMSPELREELFLNTRRLFTGDGAHLVSEELDLLFGR